MPKKIEPSIFALAPASMSDGVPIANKNFVPFGIYDDVYDIMASREFFPTYVTGPSRCGKTEAVLQAAAELGRRLLRINFTIETNENDLLGGYKLINGETVWEDGPVIIAAKTGSIALFDEYDLGGVKTLALQPVMEGNGIYLKKTNQYIMPAPGFNIIATANTKGRGNESRRYVGTQVQNEASLERWAVTLTQTYPSRSDEIKILKKYLKYPDAMDFIESLALWAENVREAYLTEGSDETITTSRLINIVQGYGIFNRNRLKTIKRAIGRFDINTSTALLEAYMKVDPHAKDAADDGLLPHQKIGSRTPWDPKKKF